MFMSMFVGLQRLVSDGEISASMSKLRQIVNGAAILCESLIENDERVHVRVYAYMLRFASLVSQQIYSFEMPDTRSMLAFELHTFLWWLLVTYLSADIGGRVFARFRRNHTQVLYWNDMVHHMPNFYCKFKMPWPFVAEDAFEMSFKLYKEYAQRVHRSTDIVGLRVFTAHRALMNELFTKNKGSRGGGDVPRTYFRDVPQADIVVHASIFKWMCRDLTGSGTPRGVAAVAFRGFLRRLQERTDGQADLITFGEKGEVTFRVGRTKVEGLAPPVLHLCFPSRDVGVHEDVANNDPKRKYCSCKKGACKGCVCAKAGLPCTDMCHGKSLNHACSRQQASSPADDAVPSAPAAGLLSVCNCKRVPSVPSLLAWCQHSDTKFMSLRCDSAFEAEFRASLAIWRSDGSRSALVRCLRAAAKATAITARASVGLRDRVIRARDNWRAYKCATRVAGKRKANFYRIWLVRCCVELFLGRRLKPNPLRLRFHLACAGF
jgi:hypothetical protein